MLCNINRVAISVFHLCNWLQAWYNIYKSELARSFSANRLGSVGFEYITGLAVGHLSDVTCYLASLLICHTKGESITMVANQNSFHLAHFNKLIMSTETKQVKWLHSCLEVYPSSGTLRSLPEEITTWFSKLSASNALLDFLWPQLMRYSPKMMSTEPMKLHRRGACK